MKDKDKDKGKEKDENKDKWLCYCLIFSGSSIGCAIVLLILTSWITPPLSLINQPYTTAVGATNMGVDQANTVVELIRLGVVIPLDVALQQLVSFYSTIISFLVSLMVLISIIAYMYIKAKSNEHAEDVAKMHVKSTTSIYFDSEPYHQKIRDMAKLHVDAASKELRENISISIGDVADDFAKVKDCPEGLARLQEQIDSIAEQLARLTPDTEE